MTPSPTPSLDGEAGEASLRPCPFCGGVAYRRELIEHYPASADGPAGSYAAWFYIGCNVCGIEVGDEYESAAADAWNRRAAIPALPPDTGKQELPALLFDGYYVWNEGLTDAAKKRTSPENVSDVLDAVVQLMRAASQPAPTPDAAPVKLWCVNVWGPDDVHAMPDKATALERANELNMAFGRKPRHQYDPILLSVVVEWPGTPESHAQDLARAEHLKQRCQCGAGTNGDCMANTCDKVRAASMQDTSSPQSPQGGA